MHRPNVIIKYALATVMAVFLWGCGSRNDSAPALDVTGKHPATWVIDHRAAYVANAGQCRECHGADLLTRGSSGGITKVGCFLANRNGQNCHALVDGLPHGPRAVAHALPFKDPALHGPEAKKNLIFCQGCHGALGGPGSNPRFNVSIGSLTNGCEDCHNINSAHAIPWKGHSSSGNLANACTLCHGATLEGGAGPQCATCHRSLLAGTVPQAGTCITCHGNPPNGNAFPNISGAHRKHLPLASVNGCTACHNGAEFGTFTHYSSGRQLLQQPPANVRFLAAYDAKAGTAAYNAGNASCLGVSCHGGNQTPPWRARVLDVNSQCTSCHAFRGDNDQFNSFFTGPSEHHRTVTAECTFCHDPAKLAVNHFTRLDTPVMEGPASSTLRDSFQYTVTGTTGRCLSPPDIVGCHSGTDPAPAKGAATWKQ